MQLCNLNAPLCGAAVVLHLFELEGESLERETTGSLAKFEGSWPYYLKAAALECNLLEVSSSKNHGLHCMNGENVRMLA